MKKNQKKSVVLLFGVSAVHLQAWSFLYRKPVGVHHKHPDVPSFTKPKEEEGKPKARGGHVPRLDQRAGEAFNASKADREAVTFSR